MSSKKDSREAISPELEEVLRQTPGGRAMLERRDRAIKREQIANRAIIPAFLLGVVLQAVAVRAMWGWYLVPLGVPAISHAHAMGLLLIVSLAQLTRANYEVSKVGGTWKGLVYTGWETAGYGMLALLGWAIQAVWM